MKVSIITVSYNSATTIKDTIESVLSQDYPQFEYIVVDGGSSDGTMEIINNYKGRITQIISEKDRGIYDAMNKGIELATGEIIGVINSDDFYNHNQVLSELVDLFKRTGADAVYGDIVYVNPININVIQRSWRAGEYNHKKIFNGWIPPHPAFFVKRSVYEKFGKFNLNFKIAADYELMLRFIEKHRIKMAYLPKVLVKMRSGGHSGRSIRQRLFGWIELHHAWTVNNLPIPFLFILRRIFYKLEQFLI